MNGTMIYHGNEYSFLVASSFLLLGQQRWQEIVGRSIAE